jgi:hypothetical protein
MTNGLTLTVGANSRSKTFSATDQQMLNAIDYFIKDWAAPMPTGMTQAQQNAWKADQALQRLADYWHQTAKANRLADLRAQQASLDAQAESDTAL